MARAGKTGKQNAILNIAQPHTTAQLRNLFKHFWDKMGNAKDSLRTYYSWTGCKMRNEQRALEYFSAMLGGLEGNKPELQDLNCSCLQFET